MKPAVVTPVLALPRSRGADLVELTKPRIAVMVLFTVATGMLLARPSAVDLVALFNTLLGVGLVAAAASVLNQFLERHSDALMRRTENRPLPAGRLQPAEGLLLGAALGVFGLVYLAATIKQPLAVAATAFTLASYVLVYTPLKRYTTLNTLIGAVPGAMPPVIGWVAVTGTLDAGALALFLILFFWQVPHFLAIAWIYREDYRRAGLQMLPTVDEHGGMTARQMLVYCVALAPVSLLPAVLGLAGWLYVIGAVLVNLHFIGATIGFARQRNVAAARRVLHASLIYLPLLLALLLVEAWLIWGRV